MLAIPQSPFGPPAPLVQPAAWRAGAPVLLDAFTAFYAEVVAVRGHLEQGGAAALVDVEAPADERPGPAEISQYLVGLLQRQALEAHRQGGAYGARLFQEALFVMAALADEVFIHAVDWPGAAHWEAHLIEARLFDSHSAGTAFFERLDALLAARDPAAAELAALYLLTLHLGFRGRYRGGEHDRELADYRARLFAFIANRAPALADTRHKLFADAYAHADDAPAQRLLPTGRGWIAAAALIVAGFVVASHLLWEHHVAALRETIRPLL